MSQIRIFKLPIGAFSEEKETIILVEKIGFEAKAFFGLVQVIKRIQALLDEFGEGAVLDLRLVGVEEEEQSADYEG